MFLYIFQLPARIGRRISYIISRRKLVPLEIFVPKFSATVWPMSESIPYGITAWRISMGRRQVVESANSALKGAFVDLGRGFFRVFGQVKMTVLLGFTVAGFNLDRIRSFRAKQAERDGAPRRRAKRRRGTWADVVKVPADPITERSTAPPG